MIPNIFSEGFFVSTPPKPNKASVAGYVTFLEIVNFLISSIKNFGAYPDNHLSIKKLSITLPAIPVIGSMAPAIVVTRSLSENRGQIQHFQHPTSQKIDTA